MLPSGGASSAGARRPGSGVAVGVWGVVTAVIVGVGVAGLSGTVSGWPMRR